MRLFSKYLWDSLYDSYDEFPKISLYSDFMKLTNVTFYRSIFSVCSERISWHQPVSYLSLADLSDYIRGEPKTDQFFPFYPDISFFWPPTLVCTHTLQNAVNTRASVNFLDSLFLLTFQNGWRANIYFTSAEEILVFSKVS